MRSTVPHHVAIASVARCPGLLGLRRRHRQEVPRVDEGGDGEDLGVAAVAEIDDSCIVEPVDPAAKKRLHLISTGQLPGDADGLESLADFYLRALFHLGSLRPAGLLKVPALPIVEAVNGFLFLKFPADR